MITVEDARMMGDALDQVSKAATVRQYRYEFKRRAREWNKAAGDLELVGDEAVIELAGSLTNGMEVLYPNEFSSFTSLVRTLTNGGQFTLHLEDPMGVRNGIYLNLFGPASPVVVKQ